MIRVKEAIVVEGKYDKIKLSSLVEGVIIETGALAFSRTRSGWPICVPWLKSGG